MSSRPNLRLNPIDPRDRRPQRIAMLPGDGIGKDVTAEAVKVLETAAEAFGLPLELVHLPWDADRYLATGETLPVGALEDFRDNWSAVFIGAYGDPRVPDMKHAADILLGIRFGLDLYINLRPIKLYDARYCPLAGRREADIDIVVFRENTEGAYVNIGGNFKRGTADEVAVQDEIHTRKGVERILRAAFDYAVAHGRRQVLMSDKSNVMRYGHDLWQRCFREVAADYPQIQAQHMFVDALAMQMVLHPEKLDVIVTNNMFGDIITDLGAALQGGLGVAASANLHPGRTSMFEPVHGSAPKYAGTGRANPVGAVLSSALMLDTLGHAEAARTIEDAVADSLRQGQTTPDLGGSLTTSEVGDLLAAAVSRASRAAAPAL
ncbi:MAG TPA: isocitrate/isopropylmalate dehydrogenase family protein [Thermoanaerobaculia bacterium]|jgi:3-isopropylmalate dehydrogenase|nr:isocitrate/isopropylmalate dehydrogenase family protein [Thermoanaerobaculia bacterium]